MMSNLGTYAFGTFDWELARAYDGEVPPPYYWQLPAEPRHARPRHHPGELEAVLPYTTLPPEFALAQAVSIEELDEVVERRARREELG